MVVGVRVESENITTGKKKHCNSSYFTMVAKGPDGKNVSIPGLIVSDDQGVRRFARSKYRKLEAQQRDTKFESKTFNSKDYVKELESDNIKIDL